MSYQVLEEAFSSEQDMIDARPKFWVGEEGSISSEHYKTHHHNHNHKRVKMFDDSNDSSCEYKQVVVGVCAMGKKTESKPMREILTRLEEFEYIRTEIFAEDVILRKPVEDWPVVDCLVSFHSKGFPLAKAVEYSKLREPYVLNDLLIQYDIQDRRKVYRILENAGIELPRYVVLDRDSPNPEDREIIESEDSIVVNGTLFNKPFVEKPISAEDHNIYIYYPSSAGGGSQRLFRKIGSRSSVYSPESCVRKTGSFIYEEFMPTDGTDVKVYTVGPDYAHAEARKSPALDGKVERDNEGKEIRYPIILTNAEKLISRQVCLAFKQTVCGFDLLRANGRSYVCDVNGFSFVKNSMKYYDDCAKIVGNMVLRTLAPQLHIPWSVPFQLDDPPIVPTTFGKMMELRCVIAVIRHGDRTPKQKMKMEVKHQKFFEMFERLGGYKDGQVKIKKPHEMQEILNITKFLLNEQENSLVTAVDEDHSKLEQLKAVLEMYGHFSGINRKVQLKYQPKGRPRKSSSEEGNVTDSSDMSCPLNEECTDSPRQPSLVLILKWGGELTPAGRVQAEELGRVFRCMYPGGPAGEFSASQGLGLLRLHSTFRHDLKIYASDEGRVQMTAAAFAKGLLALEGELTPILVQMVKSANTANLLDNDCDSGKFQNMVKQKLQQYLQMNTEMSPEDMEKLNPTHERSIRNALTFIKNPGEACSRVYDLIVELNNVIKLKKEDDHLSEYPLYHGETWDLLERRWSKLEKDFRLKGSGFDISKISDIYDCVKHDLLHNLHTLQYPRLEELYMYAKALADIVIPQEYGMTRDEKMKISLGICSPLLRKIRSDLQRNQTDDEETETVNRLNPKYTADVKSPGRHVRTRLYFTSESHIQSLLTILRFGSLFDETQDEQWRRAMEYVSAVSELNYMSQIVIMLYEDPSKDVASEERFHVELHFSPGVVCSVQKNLPVGPGLTGFTSFGFRPHNKNSLSRSSCLSKKFSSSETNLTNACPRGCIEEEDSDALNCDDDHSPEPDSRASTGCRNAAYSSSDQSVIFEETDQDQVTEVNESGDNQDTEMVAIQVEAPKDRVVQGSSCSPSGRKTLDVDEEFKTYTMTRSHSISSSSDLSRGLDAASSKTQEEVAKSLAAHSLTDVTACDNPSCQIQNRSHRHSTPGRLCSYLRLCSVVDLPALGSTRSLFSTAVISGSSSAPDLKDVQLYTDGTPVFPSIRPLETLHNALSLKQLDNFLQRVTRNMSTVKQPEIMMNWDTGLRPAESSGHPHDRCSFISPSGSAVWSGPPSFVSSSGQSSPVWGPSDQSRRTTNDCEQESDAMSESSSPPPPQSS